MKNIVVFAPLNYYIELHVYALSLSLARSLALYTSTAVFIIHAFFLNKKKKEERKRRNFNDLQLFFFFFFFFLLLLLQLIG